MKIVKSPGGEYSAVIRNQSGGTQNVRLYTKDKDQAAAIAKIAGLKKVEHLATAKAVTATAIQKILVGHRVTVADARDMYLETMQRQHRSPKTIHNNQSVVARWMTEQRLANRPISSIVESDIDPWVNGEEEGKLRSREWRLSVLRAFLKFCVDRGIALGNPANLVAIDSRSLPFELKERLPRAMFIPAELDRLATYMGERQTELLAEHASIERRRDQRETPALRAAQAHVEEQLQWCQFWLLAVPLSLNTGLRLSDICSLTWPQWDKAGHIIVWQQKTQRRIAIPITPEIGRIRAAIPITHDRLVFPVQAELNRNVKRRAYLSVLFRRQCDQSGIMPRPGKSFHSLRHAFAMRLKAEGRTIEQIAIDLGHANSGSVETYLDHP